MRDRSDCAARHAAVTNVPFPSRIAICDVAAASVVTEREACSIGRATRKRVRNIGQKSCMCESRQRWTIRFNDTVHDAHMPNNPKIVAD